MINYKDIVTINIKWSLKYIFIRKYARKIKLKLPL